MEKRTLDRLTAAFKAVEKDLSARVADLAVKSSSGRLSEEERAEYEQIVRLNDLLSALKLQAEEYWAPRGYGVERSRPVNTVACRKEPRFSPIRSIILSLNSTWRRMNKATCVCVACVVISRRVRISHR